MLFMPLKYWGYLKKVELRDWEFLFTTTWRKSILCWRRLRGLQWHQAEVSSRLMNSSFHRKDARNARLRKEIQLISLRKKRNLLHIVWRHALLPILHNDLYSIF